LLTLLYTTKLEEGSLDVEGYIKSMEAVWRRIKDVNLKLPDELVILISNRPCHGNYQDTCDNEL
jgi:hypothetical protein